jgi:hypothetical protein
MEKVMSGMALLGQAPVNYRALRAILVPQERLALRVQLELKAIREQLALLARRASKVQRAIRASRASKVQRAILVMLAQLDHKA